MKKSRHVAPHSLRQPRRGSFNRSKDSVLVRSICSVLTASLMVGQPTLLFAQTAIPAGTNIGQYINNAGTGPFDFILSDDDTWTWTTTVAVNNANRGNLSIDGQGHTVYTGANPLLNEFNTASGGGTISLTNINFTRGLNNPTIVNALFNFRTGVNTTTTLNLEGSSINNNYSTIYKHGGVIGFEGDNRKVIIDGGATGVLYANNRGENDTAGVINLGGNGSALTLEGLHTFDGNWSGNYGGAINVYEYNATLTANGELRFRNNHAVNYGGAIDFWGGNSTTNFNDVVTFDGNYVYAQAANDEHSPPHVNDNHARGGAINMGVVGSSSTVTTVNFNDAVTFSNNRVISTRVSNTIYNAYGGAVSIYDNGASRDYRLAFNDAAIFDSNYAYSVNGGGYGGALFYQLTGGSGITLQPLSFQSGTQFLNNSAKTLGGAIYLQTGPITFNAITDDIIFQGNRHGVSFSADPNNVYNYLPDSGSGTPNAIYVNGNGSLNLNAQEGYAIRFYDPIATADTAVFSITKDGEGDVAFYGDGGLTTDYDSNIRVTTTVNEGTFSLLDGVGYGTTNYGTFTVNNTGALLGSNDAELRVGALTVATGGSVGGAGGDFNLNSASINLQDGAFFVGDGTLTAASNVNLAGTVTGSIETGDTLILDVDLVGTANLAKTGEGTLALARDTAYTGTTTITEGTLRTDVVNAIDQSTVVTVAADGTLSLNNNNQIVQNLSGAGTVNLGTATLAVQNNSNTQFGGVIEGAGNVTKAGTGDLTLSGINTYEGGTRVISGNLLATGAEALSTGALTIDAGAMLFVDQTTGTSGTLAQSINGGGQFYKTGAGTLTLTSASSNLVDGDLVVQAGNLILGQDGTFNADRTLMMGSTLTFNEDARLNLTSVFLQMGANNDLIINLDDDPTAFITANTATLASDLTINNYASTVPSLASEVQTDTRVIIDTTAGITGDFASVTFGDGANWPDYLTRAGYVTSDALQYVLESGLTWYADPSIAEGTFTLTNGSDTFDVDVVLADRTETITSGWDGQSLTKAGAGTLILSENNTYTGTTSVNGGTLQMGVGNAIATSTGVSVADGATIDLNDYNQIFQNLSGGGDITLGSATLTAQNNAASTFSGDISGTGGLTKTGTGTLTLTGENTFSGDLTLTNNSGRLIAVGTAAVGEGDVDLGANSTLEFNIGTGLQNTFDNYIHGSGAVEKTGAGTLIWSEEIRANDSSIGDLIVSAGTLQIAEDLTMAIVMDTTVGDATLVLTPGADIQMSGMFSLSNDSTVIATLAGDKSSPVILANDAVLDGTLLLNGYEDYTVGNASALENSRYKVIESSTSMAGDFDSVTINGATGSPVDYLTLTHDIRQLSNEWGGTSYFYTVGLDLTWYAGTTDGNGIFTLDDASDTFNVDVVLSDQPGSATGWTGQDLTKDGPGTLILSGYTDPVSQAYSPNTYTGTTTVNGGTLQLSRVDVIADSSAVTVNTGATLALAADQSLNNLSGAGAISLGTSDLTAIYDTAAPLTISGQITGTGAFTKDGTGTLTLSNANNAYTGGTTISDGTLIAQGASALSSGAIVNEGTLQILQTGTETLSQALSGNGDLVKTGTGTLILTGEDSEQNNVTVSAGTLSIQGGDTFGALTDYTTQANATTIIGSDTRLVVGNDFIQATGSRLEVTAGVNEPSVTADTANLAGDLVVRGFDPTPPARASDLGNSTFDVVNTTAGITGTFDTVTFDTASAVDYLTLSGSVVNNQTYAVGLGLTWNAGATLGNGIFTLDDAADIFTVDVVLANQAASQTGWDGQSLTKEGDGTLILSANNTYTGTTTINGGTLQLNRANTIENSLSVLVNDGGTLSVTNNQRLNDLHGEGNIILGTAVLTAVNDIDRALEGNISGAGALTKEGTGILTLSGNNTYMGGTTVTDGTLIAEGVGTLGTGNVVNNAQLQINQDTNVTYQRLISGTGTLTKTGAGDLTLTGTPFAQDNVVVQNGGLTLNNGASFTVTDNYTTDSVATTTIGSTTELNVGDTFSQLGNATLTVSALNANPSVVAGSAALSGTLNLNDFTLSNVAKASDLPNDQYTVIQTNTGITGDFTTLNFSGATSPADYLTLGGWIDGNDYVAGLRLTWFAGATDGNGVFTLPNTNDSFDVDVILSDQATSVTGWNGQDLTKNGAGTLVLSANNTYSGSTTVNDGTLIISGTNAYTGATAVNNSALLQFDGTNNSIQNSSAVTVATGATIDLNNTNQRFNQLSGEGNITLGSGQLTANNTANTTFSGLISGTGSLVKDGTAQLTLSGDDNTYSGGTAIQAGTLYANGAGTLGTGIITNYGNGSLIINEIGDTTLAQQLAVGGNTDAGSFEKAGGGTLTLTGSNSQQGAVTVSGGELILSSGDTFAALDTYTTNSGAETTINNGTQLNVANAFTQAANSTLNVNIANKDYTSPAVVAGSATLAGDLTLSGLELPEPALASEVASRNYTVIETSSGITGDFANVDFGGITSPRDYLTLSGRVVNNTDYVVGMGLTWFAGPTNGNGVFTLANTNDSFDVDVILSDQATSVTGWNGQDLTKNGAGTLVLSANNTYSGSTTVNDGTLIISGTNTYIGATAVNNSALLQFDGTNNSIQNSTGVSVAANATIDLNNTNQTLNNLTGQGKVTLGSGNLTVSTTDTTSSAPVFRGEISGTGLLTKTGVGNWTIMGNNTYTGGTLLSGGTLIAEGAAALSTGRIENHATLNINETGNGILAQQLIGTDGALTKTGSGTLTLTGENSAQGDVTVSDGTLVFDIARNQTFSAENYVTENGATTSITENSVLQVTDTFRQDTGAQLNVAAGNRQPAITAGSAILAGDLAVTDLAFSNVTQASALAQNVFTVIRSQNAIAGDFDTVSLDWNGAANPDYLTLSSGIDATGLNYNVEQQLTWYTQDPDTALGTFTVANGNTFDVDVVLADQDAYGPFTTGWDGQSLTKAGPGTLILSEDNTYTGATTVNGGTLLLSGTNAYTGATTVNAGTLQFGVNNSIVQSSAVSVADGATIALNNYDQTFNNLSGAGDITLGSAALTANNTANTTFAGEISGAGSLAKTGNSTLTLSGANTYQGGTSVNAGTLIASQGVASIGSGNIATATGGTLVINQGSDVNYSALFSGTGTLEKTGTGTLTVAGNNSQQGIVDVNQGGLVFTDGNTFTASDAYTTRGGAETTISNGAQLSVGNTFTQEANSTLNVNIPNRGYSTPAVVVAGTANLDGNLYLSGLEIPAPTYATEVSTRLYTVIRASGGFTGDFATIDFGGLSSPYDFLTLTGSVVNTTDYDVGLGLTWYTTADKANGTFTLADPADAFNVDMALNDRTGITSGWDGQSLTKNGEGTLILSAVNNYSGTTTINDGTLIITGIHNGTGATLVNGGTLELDSQDALANSASVTLAANSSLVIGDDQHLNNLSGAGDINLGSSQLTAVNTGNLSLSGEISGTGSFEKEGAGNLTLTGVNTYSGGTIITDGTLTAVGIGALGTGSMANDANLVINQGSNANYDAVFSGSGNLTKTGSGTLTLTAANSAQGDVIVQSGGLAFDGTGDFQVANYTTENAASTTLAENAQIIASGVFTQQNGSILDVALDNSNRPKVEANTANLAGSLVVSNVDIAPPTRASDLEDRVMTIIQTQNGITGDFTSVDLGTASSPLDFLVLDSYITANGLDYVAGLALAWYGDADVAQGTFTLGAGQSFDVDVALNDRTGITSGWDGQSLTKAGEGTLILSAQNGYTGSTTLNGGMLQLNAADAIENSRAVNVNTGSTLALGANQNLNNLSGAGDITLGTSALTAINSANTEFSGEISGSGRLVKQGNATLTLSGTNSYSGGTSIDQGTLIANEVAALGSGNVLNDANLQINQTTDANYAAILSGTGTFTKNGGGTLTLTGSNSAQGAVTIGGGELALASGNTFVADSYVTNGGAVTTIDNGTQLRVTDVFRQAANSTLNVNIFNKDYDDAAVIAGTAELDGNLSLTGLDIPEPVLASEATGRNYTVIETSGGITGDFANVDFGGITSSYDYLTLEGSVIGNDYVVGLGLTWYATPDKANGAFTIGAGSTFNVDVALNDRTGITSGWDGQSLDKAGDGTLILSAANGYTGTTTVNGGTLQLNAVDTIANSSAVTLGSGSTLALGADQHLNNLSGTGDINLGSSHLTAINTGNLSLSGTIAGTGSFEKEGAGTLTLSGNNTYSGGTTITDGTLIAQGVTALGTGNVANESALVINQDTNATYGAQLSGAGSMTKNGSGTLTLTATDSTQGDITVTGGTLAFDGTNEFNAANYTTQNGAVTTLADNAQLQLSGTLTQAAGSTLNVSVGGFEPVIVAQDANLNGSLVITDLNISSAAKASEIDSEIFTIIRTTNGITGDFASVDWGTATNPLDYLTLDSYVTDNGLDYVAGFGLTWYARPAVADGTFTLGADQTFDVDVALNDRTGITSGWDGQSLIKNGDGTLILSAANGYTGTTTVNGGTLQLNAVDTIANSSAVTLGSGSTLALGADQHLNNLSGTGDINLGSSHLTAINTGNLSLSGTIAGTGSFEKEGAGTLTLSGNNTYSGGTTITDGTLIAQGAAALSTGDVINNSRLVVNETGSATLDQVIRGTGDFEKTGGGDLTLTGSQSSQGQVTVADGGLILNSNDTFTADTYTTENGATTTVGDRTTLVVNDRFTQAAGSTLSISVSDREPAVNANTANLNGRLVLTGLDTSGVSKASELIDRDFTVIHTTNGITGDFASVDFGSATSPADYLTVSGSVVNGVDYVAGFGLSWYANENQAQGTFTLGADQTFDVDVALNDRTGITSGWDGQSLTKAGEGALILSAQNGYTGSTAINGGTLQLNAADAIANSASVTVGNESTLALGAHQNLNNLSGAGNVDLGSYDLTAHNTDNLSLTGIISGTGSLTKDGTGTLTLSGDNTYSGGTTIADGRLIAREAAALGTGNVVNDAALEINQSTDGSFNGQFSGSGTFEKTGDATLTLTGNGSTQGSVTVAAGGLTLDSGDTFAVDTYTTQNGATTTLGGTTTLAVTDAFTQAAGSTLNVAVGDRNPAITAGTASLDGSLVLTGLDVTGAPKASELVDRAFTVVSTTNGITGDFSSVSFGSAQSPADYLILSGSVVDNTDYVAALGLAWYAAEDQAHGTFTLGANQTFDVDMALNDRTGITSGWDGQSLTKAGEGTLILSVENGYSGDTLVNGGTLSLEADTALGKTSLLNVGTGATVALNGTAQSVGQLNTETGARVEFEGGTLTITDDQRPAGNANGGFVENQTLFGDGLLVLDPSILTVNGANTEFTGDVLVTQGSQLILNDGAGLGDVGTITLNTENDRLIFDTVGGTMATGTLSKDLAGVGQLQTRNSADITLAGDNAGFSGLMDVGTGTVLRVSESQHLGTADVALAGQLVTTADDNWTFTNSVTGAGELDKVGDAQLIVENNLADFTGTISVNEGTFMAGNMADAIATVGASQVNVAEEAVLSGTGVFIGSVRNEGTIRSLNTVAGYESIGVSNLTVGPLTNAGTLYLAGEEVGNTLTVKGGLTSESGTLVINTVLGDDNSATDKLILDGGNTTGTTNMLVQNQGGQGAKTDVGILVVEAANGATTAEDAFVLSSASTGYRASSGTIVAGAYDYYLMRGGVNGDEESWYLSTGPDEEVTRPEVGGYLSNRDIAQNMFRHTLYDRMMGYEVVTDPITGEKYQHAAWVRVDGNHNRTYADHKNLRTKSNTFTIRAGVDLIRDVTQEGALTAGLMAGSGKGTNRTTSVKGEGFSAKGTIDGYAVGLYGTWFQRPAADEGFYADGWVQYGLFENDVQGEGLAKEKYNSHQVAASLEGGYRTVLMNDGKNSLALEPQVQVIFDRMTGGNLTEDNGTVIEQEGKNTVTTRVGARLHGKAATEENWVLEPSVEANWWHSSRKNRIAFDGTTISSDRPKDIGELRFGLTTRPRKDMAITFEVAGEFGSNSYRQIGGGIGFRLDF